MPNNFNNARQLIWELLCRTEISGNSPEILKDIFFSGGILIEGKNPCKILDEFSSDEKMCCELPLYIISDGFGKINFSEKKIRIRIFKNSNKYLEENEGKSKKPNFRFLGRVITTLSEHVVIGLESSEWSTWHVSN